MRVLKEITIIVFIVLLTQTVYASNSTVVGFHRQGQFWVTDTGEEEKYQNPKPTVDSQELPEKYDLRNVDGKSYVSPVKNQAYFGTCWAFAAASVAETSAMLKGAPSDTDLSEKALAWYTFQLQGPKNAPEENKEGVSTDYLDLSWMYEPQTRIYMHGSFYENIFAQMATWNGSSTEEEIPYCNSDKDYSFFLQDVVASPQGNWTLPYDNIYQNAYHLQDSQVFYPPRYAFDITLEEFNTTLKQNILDSGSLLMTFGQSHYEPVYNEKTGAQYDPNYSQVNHAVAVIGWDDNYPASNFYETPPGDGAWIIKNSYGRNFGDDGYIYLSYYDTSIGSAAVLDVETAESGYSYDKNYQYDYLGYRSGYVSSGMANILRANPGIENYSPGTIKMANEFTSESDETLRAFGITLSMRQKASLQAKVYILNENSYNPEDGTLVSTVDKDDLSGIGFHTIELDEPVALPSGTKYSVVVALNYHNYNMIPGQDEGQDLSFFEVELGLEDSVIEDAINEFGESVGYSVNDFVAYAEPGQSFVYGLNGDIGKTPPKWCDITDEEVVNNLAQPLNLYNPILEEDQENRFVPGNVMIKAFTTYGTDTEYVYPKSITLSPKKVYLSTNSGYSSHAFFVHMEPQNSDAPLTWNVSPSSVAQITDQQNNRAVVSSVSEGQATLTVTSANGLVETADIIVSNADFICDGIDIMSFEPDYFTVITRNVKISPIHEGANDPSAVSLYCWSETDQSDINAKNMLRIPGTSDWIYERIPVNDNTINNYFVSADHIKLNLYASGDDGMSTMIAKTEHTWIPESLYGEETCAYIAYCQNVGFVRPTVWSGTLSGLINDPNASHIEGFRISSGISGILINSEAYASQKGWLAPVEDGTFCGTMGENRPLEAIRLNSKGAFADLFDLSYRVYVKDSGWSDWVGSGGVAGNPGSGKPIQAFEVSLN